MWQVESPGFWPAAAYGAEERSSTGGSKDKEAPENAPGHLLLQPPGGATGASWPSAAPWPSADLLLGAGGGCGGAGPSGQAPPSADAATSAHASACRRGRRGRPAEVVVNVREAHWADVESGSLSLWLDFRLGPKWEPVEGHGGAVRPQEAAEAAGVAPLLARLAEREAQVEALEAQLASQAAALASVEEEAAALRAAAQREAAQANLEVVHGCPRPAYRPQVAFQASLGYEGIAAGADDAARCSEVWEAFACEVADLASRCGGAAPNAGSAQARPRLAAAAAEVARALAGSGNGHEPGSASSRAVTVLVTHFAQEARALVHDAAERVAARAQDAAGTQPDVRARHSRPSQGCTGLVASRACRGNPMDDFEEPDFVLTEGSASVPSRAGSRSQSAGSRPPRPCSRSFGTPTIGSRAHASPTRLPAAWAPPAEDEGIVCNERGSGRVGSSPQRGGGRTVPRQRTSAEWVSAESVANWRCSHSNGRTMARAFAGWRQECLRQVHPSLRGILPGEPGSPASPHAPTPPPVAAADPALSWPQSWAWVGTDVAARGWHTGRRAIFPDGSL